VADDEYCTIVRSKGATVTWSAADLSLPVSIRGQNERVTGTGRQSQTLSTTYFLCTEQAGAGKFTVPPTVLLSLPPGPPVTENWGVMTLSVGHQSLTPFAASGLELGYVASQVSRSVWVYYE
jgi:hypothetical protein